LEHVATGRACAGAFIGPESIKQRFELGRNVGNVKGNFVQPMAAAIAVPGKTIMFVGSPHPLDD
jgi:hypothetical protein